MTHVVFGHDNLSEFGGIKLKSKFPFNFNFILFSLSFFLTLTLQSYVLVFSEHWDHPMTLEIKSLEIIY